MAALVRSVMGESNKYNLIWVGDFPAENKIIYGFPDVPQNIYNYHKNR